MGTLVTHYRDKKALIKELTAGTLEHSCVGNILYTLHKDAWGTNWIGVVKLIQQDGQWAFKTMDEAMFPYFFTCPKKLLDKSTCMQENAVKWRAACIEAQATDAERKSFVKNLVKGQSLMYHGKIYYYECKNSKKGSIEASNEFGIRYRLLTRYVEKPE